MFVVISNHMSMHYGTENKFEYSVKDWITKLMFFTVKSQGCCLILYLQYLFESEQYAKVLRM